MRTANSNNGCNNNIVVAMPIASQQSSRQRQRAREGTTIHETTLLHRWCTCFKAYFMLQFALRPSNTSNIIATTIQQLQLQRTTNFCTIAWQVCELAHNFQKNFINPKCNRPQPRQLLCHAPQPPAPPLCLSCCLRMCLYIQLGTCWSQGASQHAIINSKRHLLLSFLPLEFCLLFQSSQKCSTPVKPDWPKSEM